MPTAEEMTVSERRKYLKRMQVRYVAAKRGERGRLLTEMEQVTGLHRTRRIAHATRQTVCRTSQTGPKPCADTWYGSHPPAAADLATRTPPAPVGPHPAGTGGPRCETRVKGRPRQQTTRHMREVNG